MADTKFTPSLAAGLDTSPAHPDADLIVLAQLGDQAEEEWAAAPTLAIDCRRHRAPEGIMPRRDGNQKHPAPAAEARTAPAGEV